MAYTFDRDLWETNYTVRLIFGLCDKRKLTPILFRPFSRTLTYGTKEFSKRETSCAGLFAASKLSTRRSWRREQVSSRYLHACE